jgi:hypothetical protein
VPASATSPGSGFTIANDYGTQLLLKTGTPQSAINPGWFQPIRLPGNTGGADYREDWASCANIGGTFSIGDYVPKENGNMIGPTAQGVKDLIALDPNATWNSTTQAVQNSCWETGSCVGNPGARQSPRIVALPVFDLQDYMANGGQQGNQPVLIVNILGFFVLDMVGNDVRAILLTAPGLYNSGGGTVAGPAAFLPTIMLVRELDRKTWHHRDTYASRRRRSRRSTTVRRRARGRSRGGLDPHLRPTGRSRGRAAPS